MNNFQVFNIGRSPSQGWWLAFDDAMYFRKSNEFGFTTYNNGYWDNLDDLIKQFHYYAIEKRINYLLNVQYV